MTILITGAFGFVGTNLSAYLAAKGHELWALDVADISRQDAEAQRGAYSRFFSWEDLAEIPWRDVDAVIHLAGKAHDTQNASDPKSYFEVNVGLTKQMLESAIGSWQSASGKGDGSRQDAKTQRGEINNVPAFHDSNTPVKKFLLFSSVKAVADRVEGVLTEEAVPNPQTPYGRSKLEAEREVLKCESSEVRELGATANRANEDDFRTLELLNFRTYILRPCMIHGPGNKGNLNLLYGVVRKGVPWPLGAFENRRSMASIDNVCAVVEGLLAGDAPSGVYQVADDEPLSTNELIQLIAASVGRKARLWKVPVRWVQKMARMGDSLHLPLNSERLKKLTESYVVSNEKVKRALGWKIMPLSAREGMRKTLESFSRTGAETPS